MQYLSTNTHNFYKRVSKEVFRFKSFTLNQLPEVFKLGTDAVLLGSLCTQSSGKALDIGCGTGIIALMIAQRMPSLTQITAIDTNKQAVDLAQYNFNHSIWNNKLIAKHKDLLNIDSPRGSYDLIISNPPFYKNRFLPQDQIKKISKHIDNLSFAKLIQNVSRLLSGKGIFSVILPYEHVLEFQEIASIHGLYIQRRIDIKPRPQLFFNRSVLELGFEHLELKDSTLNLRDERGQQYSEACKKLTESFYLDP
jgi:tRNA1Val (adenine37-N6)-methyltransferase